MKQLILILLINSICIYAQSNETTTDDMMTVSNETLSMETSDSSMPANEPVESKQTVSLQSAEKPTSKDDDNSNMVSSAVETANGAAKEVKEAANNAADSISSSVNNAADSVSETAAGIEKDVSDEMNSASSFSLLVSFSIFALFFISIRLD